MTYRPDGYTWANRPWTPEEEAAFQAELAAIEPPDLVDYRGEPIPIPPDTLGPEETAALLRRAELRTAETEGWPEPEDRGLAVLQPQRSKELVEDLITAGRIIVLSGEEGTGKSFATTELTIRIAAGEGSWAGTWPIVRNGPVLVLSEMHIDDDHEREETVLTSMGIPRADLRGKLWRLPLMTAAGTTPPLMSEGWRGWITAWMREHNIVLLVVDTATGATLVKPWGEEIQQVYRSLRMMLLECPDLAILLLLHMRKPAGKGARGIDAVMGEWGRWCDVVVMMENDGASLERVKITSRKRVHNQRRIIVTKRDGLLVEPIDANASNVAAPKVSPEDVIAAVAANPGMTYAELGDVIGVSKATASRYVKGCGDALEAVKGPGKSGPGASVRVFIASSRHIASQAGDATNPDERGVHRVIASPTPIGGDADVTRYDDYPPSAWDPDQEAA